ncbi:MAG: phospho-N-acetylmuramoyl-pentapeptide-transferase [Anaerovoracaceae bacterium]|nr:phospho-N-acetylmuramoyl-pentapeptide-transferase [Bacillota bacterium]MDY2670173.1 phospho-N-acetylmuramoyl-pentapeptide-transferase [Anaerovoracaceae bacterium]
MNNTMLLPVSLAVSFAVTAAVGPLVLKWLRNLHAGQSIREEGPKSHQKKAGTPTMGGIMILIGVVVSSLIFGIMADGKLTGDMAILIVSLLLCALIGFCDDFIKVVKHRNLGLTAKQKLLFQIVIAVVIAVYQAKLSEHGTELYIPIAHTYLDLGWFYIPFVVFVLVAMVNAVNLTDGLDGLAGGCTAIVAFLLALLALSFGTADTVVYSAAVCGGCLGFLIYNHHPAKVFMGDTGSLALGGALAAAAILMHIELILVIAGGIFVVEVLSVIIQVISFQTTGKRVFRMTPLHHHFELGGWKETKVVAVFWTCTAVLCLISWLMM